jgi:hypothetical protein
MAVACRDSDVVDGSLVIDFIKSKIRWETAEIWPGCPDET